HDMLRKINVGVSLERQIFKSVLITLGFAVLIVALTRPRWNPKPQQIKRQGRDIVVLLDTSRSMLAEDIRPNRLERSKQAIQDLLEQLQGDRIGIVTFAGNATVKCPLTQDYAFVRMALTDISTESTTRGGTLIGDAIRKATIDVFDNQSREFKDIILITDGDDHESFPEQAAEKAAEQGIRIIAVGLGDEDTGARIPITDPQGNQRYLMYNEEEVWIKLNGDKLREIVSVTEGGLYLGVGPQESLDLGQIYEIAIATAEKRELESMTLTQYDEKFQIFLVLAMILLISEVFVSERKRL
ncbi:MAG: VWA domain-containing protein, partial [Phycisphaeraceae bacterium]|nr:VWA domain-containing protein [Phycisphaeraceae bacterium]